MHFSAALIYSSCLVLAVVEGYSSGAPASACRDMTPGHEGSDPQSGPCPVTVTTDVQRIDVGGGEVRVKVKAIGENTFKGFMIQARDLGRWDREDSQVGHFSSPQSSFFYSPGSHRDAGTGLTFQNCGFGWRNSVTHKNSQNKREVELIWKAPTNYKGEVKFVYTVVQDFDTFWVRAESDSVVVGSADGTAKKEKNLYYGYTNSDDKEEKKNTYGNSNDDEEKKNVYGSTDNDSSNGDKNQGADRSEEDKDDDDKKNRKGKQVSNNGDTYDDIEADDSGSDDDDKKDVKLLDLIRQLGINGGQLRQSKSIETDGTYGSEKKEEEKVEDAVDDEEDDDLRFDEFLRFVSLDEDPDEGDDDESYSESTVPEEKEDTDEYGSAGEATKKNDAVDFNVTPRKSNNNYNRNRFGNYRRPSSGSHRRSGSFVYFNLNGGKDEVNSGPSPGFSGTFGGRSGGYNYGGYGGRGSFSRFNIGPGTSSYNNNAKTSPYANSDNDNANNNDEEVHDDVDDFGIVPRIVNDPRSDDDHQDDDPDCECPLIKHPTRKNLYKEDPDCKCKNKKTEEENQYGPARTGKSSRYGGSNDNTASSSGGSSRYGASRYGSSNSNDNTASSSRYGSSSKADSSASRYGSSSSKVSSSRYGNADKAEEDESDDCGCPLVEHPRNRHVLIKDPDCVCKAGKRYNLNGRDKVNFGGRDNFSDLEEDDLDLGDLIRSSNGPNSDHSSSSNNNSGYGSSSRNSNSYGSSNSRTNNNSGYDSSSSKKDVVISSDKIREDGRPFRLSFDGPRYQNQCTCRCQ